MWGWIRTVTRFTPGRTNREETPMWDRDRQTEVRKVGRSKVSSSGLANRLRLWVEEVGHELFASGLCISTSGALRRES